MVASEPVGMRPIILLQLGIIALCLAALWSVASNWPYPNHLVRPFLPPTAAYPEAQIKEWVEGGDFDPQFLAFFDRDPRRTPPPGDSILSPADGHLKYIVRYQGKTYFVIGLSFWDVHVIRLPVSGTVTSVEFKGSTLFRDRNATDGAPYLRDKVSPVQAVIKITTPHGEVGMRMITSWWASRLKVSIWPGKVIKRGDRVGRIVLGSSTTVDLPGDATFFIKPKGRVVAGETEIAPASVIK